MMSLRDEFCPSISSIGTNVSLALSWLLRYLLPSNIRKSNASGMPEFTPESQLWFVQRMNLEVLKEKVWRPDI